MAKFPSQRKLVYDIGAISETTMASEGYINLPKDLSILNRRGYASTTRKGVPLVYKAKLDFYLTDDLGTGAASAYGMDLMATMKLVGCQNNWVMKNAAVKFHAAREEMFKKAGVRKADLGAYAHEIRYAFDQASQTWLSPIDGDGNALSGGTWDETTIRTESDSGGFALKLVGQGVNEATTNTATAIQIGLSYLQSRGQVADDSNLETSDTPAKFSVLNELLRPVATSAADDDVVSDAQGQGDNPPYDNDQADPDHDITESVELGRAVLGYGNVYGSAIVEIPFGLGDLRAQVHAASGSNDPDPNGLVCVEVLDIFEMEG